MLIAIIDTRNNPKALAVTLGPLVRGVVEGLVGAAVIVASQRDEAIMEIADSAGCRVIIAPSWREGFARAIAGAGNSGALVVDAGLQLGPDFWPLLADSLPGLGSRPAATYPALPLGVAGIWPSLAHALRGAAGRVNRASALLLPPSRAREIAQMKLDPFTVRYGRALSWLKASATRVDLG